MPQITKTDRLELLIDDQLSQLRRDLLELSADQGGVLSEEQASAYARAAYTKGYCDAAQRRGPSAEDLASVGYRPDGRRARAGDPTRDPA